MKIVFNDASEMTVQAVSPDADGYLKIRIIAIPREEILAIFRDAEKTCKMVVKENRESTTYEKYGYESLTEYDGTIYEVTMVQAEKSIAELIEGQAAEIALLKKQLAEKTKDIEAAKKQVADHADAISETQKMTTDNADEITSTQEALCEVYEMIEGLVNA